MDCKWRINNLIRRFLHLDILAHLNSVLLMYSMKIASRTPVQTQVCLNPQAYQTDLIGHPSQGVDGGKYEGTVQHLQIINKIWRSCFPPTLLCSNACSATTVFKGLVVRSSLCIATSCTFAANDGALNQGVAAHVIMTSRGSKAVTQLRNDLIDYKVL